MTTALFIIQGIIALLLVVIILMQRTGADSLAGLSGGGNSAFSSKSTASALSRTTTILAFLFIANCLLIAKIIKSDYEKENNIIGDMPSQTEIMSNDINEEKETAAPIITD